MTHTCPACKGLVADAAKACVHCGHPVRSKQIEVTPATTEMQPYTDVWHHTLDCENYYTEDYTWSGDSDCVVTVSKCRMRKNSSNGECNGIFCEESKHHAKESVLRYRQIEKYAAIYRTEWY
jgi:hypothetical protein